MKRLMRQAKNITVVAGIMAACAHAPAPVQAAGYQHVPSEMVRMMQADTALVFVDVRGHTSYAEEHIQDALDVPLVDLRQGKLPEIDKDSYIVTYCGCPHAMAEEAAEIFLKNGYANVIVLDDGFYGWKDLGYPVAGKQTGLLLPFERLELRGSVAVEMAGTKIEVVDRHSGQMELAEIARDGSFVLHMPYYGFTPPATVEFRVGNQVWQRRYVAGKAYDLEPAQD